MLVDTTGEHIFVELTSNGILVVTGEYPTTGTFTVRYDYEPPVIPENDIPYKSAFWLWLRELLPDSLQQKTPHSEPNLQNTVFYRRSSFSKSGYLPARVRGSLA